MLMYVLILVAVFVGCAVAALSGLLPVGMFLLPMPVAVFVARGRMSQALGLVFFAGVASWMASGSAGVAAFCAGAAFIGVPLGVGLLQRWRYGRIVATVAGLGFLLALAGIATDWDTWIEQHAEAYELMSEQLDALDERASSEDMIGVFRERMGWLLRDHWGEMGLGITFWPVLIGACLLVSLCARWLRRGYGAPGPQGSFRAMRTPEWLVWLLIAMLGLWLADRKWPVMGFRFVSWNMAVGLLAVYWLNGVSIVAHLAVVLRPPLLVVIATVLFAMLLNVSQVLCFVGLFDTWGDFRGRIDRFAAARDARNSTGGGET